MPSSNRHKSISPLHHLLEILGDTRITHISSLSILSWFLLSAFQDLHSIKVLFIYLPNCQLTQSSQHFCEGGSGHPHILFQAPHKPQLSELPPLPNQFCSLIRHRGQSTAWGIQSCRLSQFSICWTRETRLWYAMHLRGIRDVSES